MITNLRLLTILIALASTASFAAGMIITDQSSCSRLSESIAADTFENNSQSTWVLLKQKYPIVKQFEAGKGGTYVALVKDAKGAQKVLKVFPSIATEGNKYNYRELFYTCLNGFITYQDLGITISNGPNTNAFPRLFEVGVTNALKPDAAPEKMVFPYMVFEFVDGKSFTDLGKEAKGNEKVATFTNYESYSVYPKSLAAATNTAAAKANRRKTEYILAIIAQIFNRMQTMQMHGQAYGFSQNDFNPGNSMILKRTFSGKIETGFGAINMTDVPLVTFIDFGHSTSNLDGQLGAKVKNLPTTVYQKNLKTFSGSLGEFYEYLNGTPMESSKAWKTLPLPGSDLRLFKQIIIALADSGNFLDDQAKSFFLSCSSKASCINEAPPVFRILPPLTQAPSVSPQAARPRSPEATSQPPRPAGTKQLPEPQSKPPKKPSQVPPH